MEPALDVINRALHGDPGARSFLERTTSIYVLDVTDRDNPKTYGCWNFIHQAMNETERYEAKKEAATAHHGSHEPVHVLVDHVRLLASMALRVARRSPRQDKALVSTCIANAAEYSATTTQLQWLVDLNLELREIVMGRIAAMAFDFSFHRLDGLHGRSAFADRVVLDSFCAILAANAVTSGPAAIKHLMVDWIIPSSRNLPSFSVASVVLHVASEAMRKTAPAGTKDMLQQLSATVICIVIASTLADAATDNSTSPSSPSSSSVSQHHESSRIASMCLGAIKAWCDATDLSLPQIKHVSGKTDIDIVSILSDIMYSDSEPGIDALAELIESTIQVTDEKVMSEGRMNQVKHIMQVDEAVFRARFTPTQLKTIESSEMESIIDELVSAIALQRFRFVERQSRGDHDVCRNLARIAATLCTAAFEIRPEGEGRRPDFGALNLLMKAASHPHVNICAIALHVLTLVTPTLPSISLELLPILQRRAIVPHYMKNHLIALNATEISGVSFDEFQSFRDNVLTDTLIVCWRENSHHYMDSCTLAVEEFCSSPTSMNVSLQLEAALFCIEQIGTEALDSHHPFPHAGHMTRIFAALGTKPDGLLVNPLTRARLCRLVRKYSRCYVDEGGLDICTDLSLTSFMIPITATFPNPVFLGAEQHDVVLLSVAEAAYTIKQLLCRSPQYFAAEARRSSLSEAWKASQALRERNTSDTRAIDARLALCTGLCRALATLDEEERYESFESLATPETLFLDQLVRVSQDVQAAAHIESILVHISDEIRVLSTMARCIAQSGLIASAGMESGCDTSPDKEHAKIPDPVYEIMKEAWPAIMYIASTHTDNEHISLALASFLTDLLPPGCSDASSLKLLKDLCSVVSVILAAMRGKPTGFDIIVEFVGEYVHMYGEGIEKVAVASIGGNPIFESDREVGQLLEETLLQTVKGVQDFLGSVWASPSEQGNGQVAFESKPEPVRRTEIKSNDALGGALELLTRCLEFCPIFLLHLPLELGADRDDDKLLRRAVNSSVASLQDGDPGLTKNAVHFLQRLIKGRSSEFQGLQSFVAESLMRIHSLAMKYLLAGCCGRYDSGMIADVADLLLDLLRSATSPAEREADLVSALREDFFRLGDAAKNLTYSLLLQTAQQDPILNTGNMTAFLEDVWELHRSENTDVLPNSDAVAHLLQRYGGGILPEALRVE